MKEKMVGRSQYILIQISKYMFKVGTVLLAVAFVYTIGIWFGFGWAWDNTSKAYIGISNHFPANAVDKMLAAFGIFNVFCSYMITARGKTVYGIKLLNIMNRYFKNHGLCFIAYTIAVILGIYFNNLALNHPSAVYMLIVVLVYTLSLVSFSLVFSFNNGWEKKITEYYVRTVLLASNHNTCDEENTNGKTESNIRSAAVYIHEYFNDNREVQSGVIQSAVEFFGSMPFEIKIPEDNFSYVFYSRGRYIREASEQTVSTAIMARIFYETIFDGLEKPVRQDMIHKCLKTIAYLQQKKESVPKYDKGKMILLCGLMSAIMKLYYNSSDDVSDYCGWLSNIMLEVANVTSCPEEDCSQEFVYLFYAVVITVIASLGQDKEKLQELWDTANMYFKKIKLECVHQNFGYGQIVNIATGIIRPIPEYGWIKAFQACKMVSLLFRKQCD